MLTQLSASAAGVRKHCRKHHPQWLAKLDEQAKEGRTHNRSELYCVPRLLTADEAAALQREEPRKRQRMVSSPTDLNRAPSEENMRLDSPSSTISDTPRVFATPHHMPLESPRGEIIFEHAWAVAVPMPPLRLDEDLPLTPPVRSAPSPPSPSHPNPRRAHARASRAHRSPDSAVLPAFPAQHPASQGPPIVFNFNAAMPPPKRGASLGSSIFPLDQLAAEACEEAEEAQAARLESERLFSDVPTASQADAFFASVFA
jgi:hypothetical protein